MMIQLKIFFIFLSFLADGLAIVCDNSPNGRRSCEANGEEPSAKSTCENTGCCWNASFNGIPNCFHPKSETNQSVSTYTYTVTYSICVNCNASKEKKVNETLDAVRKIFTGKSPGAGKNELKEEISAAFSGLAAAESASVMEKFLSTALDIYQAQSSDTSEKKATVDLWIDFFDILIDFSAAKVENNPKTFLNVSSEILVSEVSSRDAAVTSNISSYQVIEKLESYAIAMTSPLLGNVSQEINATFISLDFNNAIFSSCFENENYTGCDIKNQYLAATVTSPGVRAYVTSVTYNSNLNLHLLPDGVFGDSNARVGSSLFSVTSHDGEDAVLNTRLLITFADLKSSSSEVPVCAFISSSNGDWSTEGCDVDGGTSTPTSCACNHNTSFAMLFLHSNIEISDEEKNHFEIITYIGSGTSITALMITIFCFFYLKLTRIRRVLLHLNLSLTLCFGQIILLIGTSITPETAQCKAVAILLHFFFMSSFSWMLMEGILLYFQSVRAIKGDVNFKLMMVFGWILPLVVVGISLAAGYEGYGSDNGCWLSIQNGLTWAFIGPALGFILINTILLGLIVRVFLKLKSNAKTGEWERTKRSVRAIVLLTPLLGITWIFGALAIDESTKWFLYLFSICNSLQGLAIFFFHCLHNYDVRKAFLKKYRRSFQNVPPFFSSVTPTSTGKSFVKTTTASISTPTMTTKNWH